MSYTLYTNGVLEKDGYYVPLDDLNPDYIDYLAFIEGGGQPVSADPSIYMAKLADDKLSVEQIKAAYQEMITRLEQIESAGALPFTAQGFTQMQNAIKDLATYQKRIMKYLRAQF